MFTHITVFILHSYWVVGHVLNKRASLTFVIPILISIGIFTASLNLNCSYIFSFNALILFVQWYFKQSTHLPVSSVVHKQPATDGERLLLLQ
jgi:hypothetical protein